MLESVVGIGRLSVSIVCVPPARGVHPLLFLFMLWETLSCTTECAEKGGVTAKDEK